MSMPWRDGFFMAVEQMRTAQKAYFRTRMPAELRAAKKCEAKVDGMIKREREGAALEKQTELFGGEQ